MACSRVNLLSYFSLDRTISHDCTFRCLFLKALCVPYIVGHFCPSSQALYACRAVCCGAASVSGSDMFLMYVVNIDPNAITQRLTAKSFAHCPSHTNALVQQTGIYTSADLTNMYKYYRQTLPNHVLLSLCHGQSQ